MGGEARAVGPSRNDTPRAHAPDQRLRQIGAAMVGTAGDRMGRERGGWGLGGRMGEGQLVGGWEVRGGGWGGGCGGTRVGQREESGGDDG